MDAPTMDDATLVSRAVGGDRDAFAAVYDRDGGAVFDLCTAILRNQEEAADATLDSFLRAARELVNLRDRSRLRLWLLAVARHEATSRAQSRRQEGRPDPAGEAPDWDPAEALSEGDRAVLHLHLRHQLDGEDLAAVVGMKPAGATARAAKLRTMAETSVGALLLSRADGAGDPSPCAGLAQVLEGWDGRFTPAIGVRINRHARKCDACQARRAMLLERLRAMASLPFADPPPWLRAEVLLRMELAVSPRTLPGWAEDGFPPGIGADAAAGRSGHGRGRRRGRVVAVAGAVAVLVVAGVLVVSHDWGGDSTVSASGGSTSTSPPTTATTPTTVRAVASPTTVTPTTGVPSTVPSSPTSVPVDTSAPAPPPPGPAPVPPDRDPPAIAFGAEAASAYVFGCPYSRTGVSADVADPSQVTWVALFVIRPDGVQESMLMTFDGGRWRASMGDFDTPGTAYFWVEAIDGEGNRAQAPYQVFEVFACP